MLVYKIKSAAIAYTAASNIKNDKDRQTVNSMSESKYYDIPNYLTPFKRGHSAVDAQELMMRYNHKLSESQFQKHQELLINDGLKQISQKIYSKGLMDYLISNYITDIDRGLQNIEDEKIKTYINDIMHEMKDIEIKKDSVIKSKYFEKLGHIGNIVDTYNELNGNYTGLMRSDFIGYDLFYDYNSLMEYLFADSQKEHSLISTPWFKREIDKYVANGKIKQKSSLAAEFINLQKTTKLAELKNDDEISDYLYTEYYVKKLNIADSHKQLLLDINSQFSTKVLLSSFYYERKRELEIIQKEFKLWQKVSNGKAKFPKILDMNRMKAELENASGVQYVDDDIWLKGSGFSGFRLTLRHELLHLNDLYRYKENFNSVKDKELAKLVNELMPSKTIIENGIRKKVLDYKKCPYKEEFLRAGISPHHIKHAYSNREEFIAVAAEGDMRKYSPEFKNILIRLGMPEFVLELPCLDKKTKSRAANYT